MPQQSMKQTAIFAINLNYALDKIGQPSRGRLGFIQSSLSRPLSLVAIRKWLNGESLPKEDLQTELAQIVDVSVSTLFNENIARNIIKNNLANESLNLLNTPVSRPENERLSDQELGVEKKQFDIVVGTPDQVSERITSLLADGWELCGGLSVASDAEGAIYQVAQSVLKIEG